MKQVWIKSVLALLTIITVSRADELPAITLQLVAKVEERPVLVTHDGQNRLFIVEQPGRIRLMKEGKLLDKPYLDICDKLFAQGEGGLLGVAFHPKFKENGLMYINCTMEDPTATKKQVKVGNKTVMQAPIQTVIIEYKCDPAADVVNINSERIVMKIDQPYENHNGGMVEFGPDGMLYICMGDGGNQRDPHKNGQNMNVLLAKMLRIDVSPRQGYAIPKDNPFVGIADAKPEIFALGLRNAWRFCFDQQTGLLYAADVGEDRWEEINIVTSGANYGWSDREGAFPFVREKMKPGEKPPTAAPTTPAKYTDPIKGYWHNLGQSITGGNVYRGSAIPQLQGWYLYGDYSKGTLWGLKYDGKQLVGDEVIKITNEKQVRPMLPSGFGTDSAGEIYICSHQDGKIWKIVPAK